jgi:hypothetical protein
MEKFRIMNSLMLNISTRNKIDRINPSDQEEGPWLSQIHI